MANFTSEAIGHQKFVAQCNQRGKGQVNGVISASDPTGSG
jgi:hypothetical protein